MIKKREVYYFKIAEEWANTKFEIGDGYGILKVYEEDIKEMIEMTGCYYINEDGKRENTDDQFWTKKALGDTKFYSQDTKEELNWDDMYKIFYFEYWNGHNWKTIWLDWAGMSPGDVEDITEEIGKLKRIGVNEEQTYNEYAYVSSNGKYYYKYSSFFVGSLDFLEETDIETLQGKFEAMNLGSIKK